MCFEKIKIKNVKKNYILWKRCSKTRSNLFPLREFNKNQTCQRRSRWWNSTRAKLSTAKPLMENNKGQTLKREAFELVIIKKIVRSLCFLKFRWNSLPFSWWPSLLDRLRNTINLREGSHGFPPTSSSITIQREVTTITIRLLDIFLITTMQLR